MAKYNIYQLKQDKLEKLIEKLISVGYSELQKTDIGGYEVVTYFTKNPRPTDIWWLEQFSQLFGEYAVKKNEVFSGLLTIRNKTNGAVFLISLGKTHFYVQEFIDYTFGLKVAERIGSSSGTKSKSSKHFAGQTSKSVTSFVGDSILNFTPGEATDYVKLKPSNKELWGKAYIHFGTSVQFTSLEIEPSQLNKVFEQLETALTQDASFSLPRMLPIKDEDQIAALDANLAQAINDNDSNLGVVDFELYGVDFVFAQETHAKLEYDGLVSGAIPELTTDSVKTFADEHSLNLAEVVREIKVKLFVNDSSKFTVPLINMLDFIGNEDNFLHRGKWYIFSKSFVDSLSSLIETVEVETLTVGYSKTQLGEWQEANKDKAITYREKYVIDKLIEAQPTLVEYDRSIDYQVLNGKKTNIEVADIYNPDEKEITVVKIGDAKSFGYAFDQAMRTLALTNANTYQFENGNSIKIEKLRLLLVTTRMAIPSKATDINSLSFQIKLSELVNLANEKRVKLTLAFDKYENT